MKRLDLLVDAFVDAARLIPDATLLIVGTADNAQLLSLRHRLSIAGLTDRVIITGMVDPALMPSMYAQSSVFVLPSDSEGMSMSMIEAMASGIPIVATEGSARGWVSGSHAGFDRPGDHSIAAIPRLGDEIRCQCPCSNCHIET